MRRLFFVFAAILILGAVSPVAGGQVSITNDSLRVVYDSVSSRFSVQNQGSGRTFLTQGQLSDVGGTSAVPVAVADPNFGAGWAIQIAYPTGNRDQIMLFPHLPFVLFQTILTNGGTQLVVFNKIHTVSTLVDLGLPTTGLTTAGTGGLVPPASKPGSYQWLAVADPATRNGVVSGWLTDDRGSGTVFGSVSNGLVRVDGRIDYGRLRISPGQTTVLETLAIGYFDDARLGLEAWADAIAQVYHIHLPPQPDGYCTYSSSPHGGASSPAAVAQLANFAKTNLMPFGFSMLQIDGGWQDGITSAVGSRHGPQRVFIRPNPTGAYAAGMKPTADYCRAAGITPGLWFEPFAGTQDDPYFTNHLDWFVKTTTGAPYWAEWGGTCLDMTYAPARNYVSNVVSQIANVWGYKYFKLDGLWTGAAAPLEYINSGYTEDGLGDAVFANPNKPNIEAFRDGLRLVRQAAGLDVFLLGCCAPQNMRSYGGAFGLVDAMRIGPDNKADSLGLWSDFIHGPQWGSRSYFLHRRVWYNDPDAAYVRDSDPLNDVLLLCSWTALSGELFLDGDWLPTLSASRLDILKRCLPNHGLLPRPVDYLDNDPPQVWLLTDTRRTVRRDVIGIFNWNTNHSQAYNVALSRLGLPGTNYVGFDFWSNTVFGPISGTLQTTLPARSCQVLAVRPVSSVPQVISTSRHITQGMVDLLAEEWNGTNTLAGASQLIGGDAYELRILAPSDHWHVISVAVSAADQAAGVLASFAEDGCLARVTLRSPIGRPANWSVVYTIGPSVRLTHPANQAVYYTNSIILLAADASSEGAAIESVAFYNGSAWLGTATNAPYVLSVSNLTAGVYGFSARTVDALGRAASSGTVTVRVEPPINAARLVWQPEGSGIWDLTNTVNWFDPAAGTRVVFSLNDQVTFDDSGGAWPMVMLPAGATVAPTAITDASSNCNYTLGGAGKITGALTFLKTGASTFSINTTNDFTGTLTVGNGILAVGNAGALGAAENSLFLTNTGALDLNGVNLTARTVTACGTGGGGGAIVNRGAQQVSALRNVVLTGDTALGGSARWDVRAASTGSTNGCSLSTGGQPFRLVKVGSNQVSLVAVAVDPALGDIDVVSGTFALETATSQVGNPNRTITVWGGATLDLYRLTTTPLNKRLALQDGSTLFSENDRNVVRSPIELEGGKVTVAVTNAGGGPPALVLSNNVSGAGGLVKTGAAPLVLAASNSYAGDTRVAAGALALIGSGAIGSSLNIVLASGTALDVSGRGDRRLTLNPGQALSGTGTVTGSLTVGAGAGVAPGNPIGMLTVTNEAILEGTTVMTLDQGGGTNSVLAATDIVLGGVLVLTNLSGTFAVNDRFKLFQASSYAGAFARILPAMAQAGMAWDTNTLINDGILRLVSRATPKPVIIGATSGPGLALKGTNGVPGLPYYVLTQTNLAVPFTNWSLSGTGIFDLDGRFAWTNKANGDWPQRFYVLELL